MMVKFCHSSLIIGISLVLSTSCQNECEYNSTVFGSDAFSSNAFVCTCDTSKTISLSKAQSIAFKAINPLSTKSGIIDVHIDSITDSEGQTMAYIFNYGDNEGFAIISASRKLRPVLAFSESGNFRKDAFGLPGLDNWIESLSIQNLSEFKNDSTRVSIGLDWADYLSELKPYSNQTRSYGREADDIAAQAVAEWYQMGYKVWSVDDVDLSILPYEMEERVEAIRYDHQMGGLSYGPCFVLEKENGCDSSVSPMIKTEWQQGYPYNCTHPLWNESDFWEYYYAYGIYNSFGHFWGCVPIAISQIMYYNAQPATKYAFSSMPLKMYSHLEEHYLPDFIKSIGTQCGIDYSRNQTRATLNKAKEVFAENGFTSDKVGYSTHAIMTSLKDGSPVMMGGDGHAWICDGMVLTTTSHTFDLMVYTGDLAEFSPIAAFGNVQSCGVNSSAFELHMVWGWEPEYNGYFTGDSWSLPKYGTFKTPDCLVNFKFISAFN